MTDTDPSVTVVSALIRSAGDVLIVLQQGPADGRASWFVPGGRVEPGESPLEALRREVREETGLEIGGDPVLAYMCDTCVGERRFRAQVFLVSIWSGELRPRDPDGLVTEARFTSVGDAIALVAANPIQRMREPLVAYLSGVRRQYWEYREPQDGS